MPRKRCIKLTRFKHRRFSQAWITWSEDREATLLIRKTQTKQLKWPLMKLNSWQWANRDKKCLENTWQWKEMSKCLRQMHTLQQKAKKKTNSKCLFQKFNKCTFLSEDLKNSCRPPSHLKKFSQSDLIQNQLKTSNHNRFHHRLIYCQTPLRKFNNVTQSHHQDKDNWTLTMSHYPLMLFRISHRPHPN